MDVDTGSEREYRLCLSFSECFRQLFQRLPYSLSVDRLSIDVFETSSSEGAIWNYFPNLINHSWKIFSFYFNLYTNISPFFISKINYFVYFHIHLRLMLVSGALSLT